MNVYCRGLPKAQPRSRHSGMAIVAVMRRIAFNSPIREKKWVRSFLPGDELCIFEKPRVISHEYNPDSADAWKDAVRKRVEDAWAVYKPDPVTGHRGVGRPRDPLNVPLCCDLTFYMPRPKYMLENPFKYGRDAIPFDGRPDIDNLQKAVFDAMTEAGVWRDDALVCTGEVSKWYSGEGGAPGVRIIVETIEPPIPGLFDAPASESRPAVSGRPRAGVNGGGR